MCIYWVHYYVKHHCTCSAWICLDDQTWKHAHWQSGFYTHLRVKLHYKQMLLQKSQLYKELDNVVDKQQLLVKPRSTNCYSAGVHTICHDYNTLVTLPSTIYCYQGHWTGHCIIANLIEHVKLGNLGNWHCSAHWLNAFTTMSLEPIYMGLIIWYMISEYWYPECFDTDMHTYHLPWLQHSCYSLHSSQQHLLPLQSQCSYWTPAVLSVCTAR